MESILTSIKKLVGLFEEQTEYDQDIIEYINSAFALLNFQLGIGPEQGFFISGDDTTWDEYMDESSILQLVRDYVYLSVQLDFDPPTSSSALQSLKDKRDKVEWMLSTASGSKNQNGGQ